MNTCGTCKHKGEPKKARDYRYFYGGDGYFREDGKPIVMDGNEPAFTHTYFLCERIKHIQDMYSAPEVAGEKAFCIDGSGYYAALCVEDDFGCNQWEGK